MEPDSQKTTLKAQGYLSHLPSRQSVLPAATKATRWSPAPSKQLLLPPLVPEAEPEGNSPALSPESRSQSLPSCTDSQPGAVSSACADPYSQAGLCSPGLDA